MRGGSGQLVLLTLLIVSAAAADERESAGRGAGQGDEAAAVEFLESRVRPILAQRCYECHSAKTGSENGALILETAAGIAAGGSRGPMFLKDMPELGLMLQAVRYTDPDLQMPPEGKLPPSEIAVLEEWVRRGAKLPAYKESPRPESAGIDFDKGRQFWSFQPLSNVAVPEVRAGDVVHNSIDRFVLAKLHEHNLEPNSEAVGATLLRRLTFDVIGLPPTVEQISAFEAGDVAQRYEETVDQLLASPQFGERWARVWLDLARYTDFTPDWQNPTDRGWMYRDWVVDALNENMPYDQFLRLQLAADQIPGTDPQDLAALGFLGLSPTYWKELRLAPAVIEQIVADEWDERIDAVTRTMMGLTVSCARCHDHKFDPISTEDYYGLAGVFASTQLAERPLLNDSEAKVVRDAKERIRVLEEQLKPLREKKSPEAEGVEKQIEMIRQEVPLVSQPFAHVIRDAAIHVLPEGDELTKLEYRENEPRDLPVFRRGNPANTGAVIPRRFLTLFREPADGRFVNGSGRAELGEAMLTESQGLVARVIVNRIWDQHFGAGLVRTPSDFGLQGDRPTHPELLEFLASELVTRGWDLRWLHRTILMSATYRRSSDFRPDADAADPDNRLLWRANRRRLDFEMWRDATLSVSGQLDLTAGGPSKAIDDPTNVRRSLYVTVAREELHPVLRMHDFPEASAHSPRRLPTTTPLQQLYVLNSPWMQQQADAIQQRLSEIDNPEDRIEFCYRLMFARKPSAQEQLVATEFLRCETGSDAGNAAAEQESRWRDYLHALLGLNEFHFVD